MTKEAQRTEQEPVAWTWNNHGSIALSSFQQVGWQPLYTTPPQRKPWVGLTDEEIQAIAKQARSKDHAVTLTNKFLKEKNT